MAKKEPTLTERVGEVQYIFLGIAVASLIIFYNRESFKEPLGKGYELFTMILTSTMLFMFALSGWQFVKIARKITTFSKRENIEEAIKEEDEQ